MPRRVHFMQVGEARVQILRLLLKRLTVRCLSAFCRICRPVLRATLTAGIDVLVSPS
jgi:hypothetical protein